MTFTLPQGARDVGFQRHIARLERAEQVEGHRGPLWRAELARPWVKDAPFEPNRETHCPHGHVDAHEISAVPEPLDAREHMRRRCLTCGSTWLEPVQA